MQTGGITQIISEMPAFRLDSRLAPTVEKSSSFEALLNSYMGLVDKTNTAQIHAEGLQVDYATGRTDDMLAVMLAQEEAYTSLSFTVQVTSRIIDAYNEIMRMSL